MSSDHGITNAFNQGDAAEFKHLLLAHPEFLRSADGSDQWMWQACMDGNLAIAQTLVELGVDVNETRDHGNTDDPFYQPEGAIIYASDQGHLEVVRWLLEKGARINYVVHGKKRCFPLMNAAESGHLDIVKLLVDHGADVHATWNGTNAATQAEDYGNFEVRDYLRSLGAKTVRETTPPDYTGAHRRLLEQVTREQGPLADWQLKIPGNPLVTLRLIPANEKRDVQTLFTVGLSDHPLPQGEREHACTELRVFLPPDWKLTKEALKDPLWNWPVEWLKRIAADLRGAARWPGLGAAVAAGSLYTEPVILMNGDPPQPLAPNTKLCGWLGMKALSESVQAPDYRWIDVHSLFPIYAEEEKLVREKGYEQLVKRLQARKVPLYIDPKRPNMAVSSGAKKEGRTKNTRRGK